MTTVTVKGPLFTQLVAGKFEVISPKDGRKRLRVGVEVLNLLAAAQDPITIDDLVATQVGTQNTAVLRVIDLMMEHGVLVKAERSSTGVHPYGHVAALFHEHARSARYAHTSNVRRQVLQEVLANPSPSSLKSYEGCPTVPLPRDDKLPRADFETVLLSRRTHRDFSSRPVRLADLSTVLRLTFGPQKFVSVEGFGLMQLKTSPNAGGRQEIECYVMAMNVQGLERAAYHYDVMSHSLTRLPVPALRHDAVVNVLNHQDLAATAPVFVVTTVVPERVTYKYPDGRAYRLWSLNAGHIGQTFALTATALGMGPFQTAAYKDSELETMLGIESPEFVSYVLGFGWPADDRELRDPVARALKKESR